MQPVNNWRDVLKRAWSVRLMVLAAILSGFEVAIPFLHGWVDLPAGIFAGVAGIVTCLAFVARLVAQKGLSGE